MVLIFDMDGVIVDNHQFHFDAFVEFGKKHNITITRESFSPNFGKTNSEIMQSIFGRPMSEAEIKVLADEKEQIYRDLYKPYIQPIKGLTELLKNASSRGIPVAMGTSAPTENVVFTLAETGLSKYFDVITDSSMVKHGKPDPEIYLLTAERLGIEPSECLVFEDSHAGIAAAKAAGMKVIGLATTYSKEELSGFVDDIIPNFEGVSEFLGIN